MKKRLYLKMLHQIGKVFSAVTFLIVLACTLGERNNPVDPGNPDHVDPPVVYLSIKDTTIFIKDTLDLKGSCNDQSVIEHYEWKIGSKTETTKSAEKKVIWNNPGQFVVTFRAINKYKQESEWISCKVNVLLGQPVLFMDSTKICYINDTIAFDALGKDSNSADNELEYFWAIQNSKFEKKGASIRLSFPDTGKKVIRVKVRDKDSVESSVVSCNVTVKEGRPMVTLDFYEETINVRDSITITPDTSDENGIVKKYIWQYTKGNSTTVDTANPGPKKFAWPDSGLKTVSVRVIDDDNLVSQPVTCIIHVGIGPIPWVSIASSASCCINRPLNLQATGDDSNGAVVKFIWQYSYNGLSKIDTTVSGIHEFKWTVSDSGLQSVIVKAIDNDGQLSVPATCLITVSAGFPTINKLIDLRVSTTNASGCKIILNGHDEICSSNYMTWLLDTCTDTCTNNPFVWDISSKDSIMTFNRPSGGRLRVIWAVKDDDGQVSNHDTFFISFNRPPATPVLSLPDKDTAQWNTILSNGKGSVNFKWDGTDPDSNTDISNFRFILNNQSGTKIFDSTGMFKTCTIFNHDTLKRYSWRLVTYDLFGDSAFATGSFMTSFGFPVITLQPKATTIFKGDSIKLNIGVTGKGTLTYQWMKNGTSIEMAKQANYLKAGAVYSDSGYYKCIVSNTSGSVTSDSVKVVVLPVKPKINIQPKSVIVQQQTDTFFFVSAEGEFLQYKWQKNGGNITINGNSDTLMVDSALLADSGAEFRCIVSNAGGSVTSDIAILSVKLAPPVIEKSPSNTSVLEGGSICLGVNVKGDRLKYQWQKDSIDIAGANQDSICISYATLMDSGSYWCIVWNDAGKDTSNEAKLNIVHVLPKYTLTTTALPSAGGSISLSPTGGTYDSGTVVTLTASTSPGYEFSSWSGSATGTNASVTVVMTGNKSVTANFSVHILPQYTLTTVVNPTTGGSVSLSPSGGTYDSGTVVTLTASNASGYDFSGWAGSVTGTSTSTTVTMTGNKSVTANFSVHVLPRYTLTTTVQPSAGGSITLSPSGDTYDSGTVVTLTASKASGYDFSNWSGSASGTSTSATVTMTGNKSVTANFVGQQVKINISNQLQLPIRIYINGSLNTTIDAQSSDVITINPKPNNLLVYWRLDRSDIDGRGEYLKDTIIETSSVSNSYSKTINNIVNGQLYFYARVANLMANQIEGYFNESTSDEESYSIAAFGSEDFGYFPDGCIVNFYAVGYGLLVYTSGYNSSTGIRAFVIPQ
ncbi:MAG TPA: immunoglobulin domain-containing protein [Chitinispirillaceae bacterium]|nr:immunoglobulin domain-containing protein [Chitinispirillaceae bacterium]